MIIDATFQEVEQTLDADFGVLTRGEKGADGTVAFDDLTDEQKASLKGEKGEKGDKGEKGEKGDAGDAINVDETYNPESLNAQSGKAVAEAVKGKIDKRYNQTGDISNAPFAVYAEDNIYGVSNGQSTQPSSTMLLYVDDGWDTNVNHKDILEPHRIPMRDEKGNLWSGTPIDDYDVATKKYVDEHSGGGGSAVNKLDKMTDKAPNTASGKMYPRFYAVDNINGVVSDTLLKGSWGEDANTIPLRDANGQIQASTVGWDDNGNKVIHTGGLVNKSYLESELGKIEIPTFIPRKLNHTWKDANGTVAISRSNAYFCCGSNNSGDVHVVDENGTAVKDGEGDTITPSKVFILVVPENTTTYNGVKGYMCFSIRVTGSSIFSADVGAGNIFVPTDDMEAGKRFIKTTSGMNVWTMPFDI